MELDPEWYAYQCSSGEVLFYYHAVTGEHRWAIHFCTCLKSKMANSTAEPCCLWEPVKSKTCESGKFVRSIGTETEDQYFTANLGNEEVVESPRAEITFEYSVSKDRLNEGSTTGSSCADNTEKPVEVFLEDPFVSSDDNQNSSKRITLKLKEISSQEFSLADNIAPRRMTKRVDDIRFPRKSLAVTKGNFPSGSHKGGNVLHEAKSSTKHSFVGQRKGLPSSLSKKQSLPSSSSLGVLSSSVNERNNDYGENSPESMQGKRQRSSASSRKNPEPRKLIKKTNSSGNEQSQDEWDDSEMQEYYEDQVELTETKMFDGTEEHSLGEDPIVMVGEPSSSSQTSTLTKQEGEFKDDADDQPSVCQLCGKECATPAMLTNHLMKHQPSGTSCPICNKYFSRRQGLRYHVQTHAGDKPHICKICNKTFTKSASLVAHYRTHSGIRPFKCPKCNKGFTHSSNLSSHLRIHSSLRPYRCNFCSKGFKTSSHLTLHLRSHSDERPYECAECGKAFKNSSHLRSHEKLHLLPKTVFCKSCGEGFRSFSHMIYHQQTNPQCAEDDEQEQYQAHGQNLQSNSRQESKVKHPQMGEPRTYQNNRQSNNEMERHSELHRKGLEYDALSNMDRLSSQGERQAMQQSSSDHTMGGLSQVERRRIQGEHMGEEELDKRQLTQHSAGSGQEMEYEEQDSQLYDTRKSQNELEKPTIIEEQSNI